MLCNHKWNPSSKIAAINMIVIVIYLIKDLVMCKLFLRLGSSSVQDTIFSNPGETSFLFLRYISVNIAKHRKRSTTQTSGLCMYTFLLWKSHPIGDLWCICLQMQCHDFYFFLVCGGICMHVSWEQNGYIHLYFGK